MKAAIEAVKFGFAIFLLAFLVVWVPELMLLGTSVTWTLIILAATLAGIFLACLVWRGVFITDLGWPIRIAAALGAVSLFAFTINRNYLILAVGCVLLIAVIFQQIVERRKERQREMGSTGLVT